MKIAVQYIVVVGLGVLLYKGLAAIGMPWFIYLPAALLLGMAVGKYWWWDARARKNLAGEREASVLGAMLLGARTTTEIWAASGRLFPTVMVTLFNLEKRGMVISLQESDEDGPPRRVYYLTSRTEWQSRDAG